MPYIRQTNFSGGEISPRLWGRTDLARRNAGLRTLKNFFVDRSGAALSRPGTTLVGRTALYTGSAGSSGGLPVSSGTGVLGLGAIRLIDFVYSDDLSYVLEFTALTVRFYSNGAVIEDPASPGTPLKVATPYTAADIDGLRWVQSGDVLTITHPNHPPCELIRTAHDAWSLDATGINFDRPAEETHATVCLLDPLPVEDIPASMPARQWKWLVTSIFKRTDGTTYETGPFEIGFSRPSIGGAGTALPSKIPVYPSKPVTVAFDTSGLTSEQLISKRIYRGQGDMFGWIGDVEVQGATTTWTDAGDEPDYSQPPPKGTNPFKVYDVDGTTLLRTEKPAAVAYFEDRLVFGGTAERPDHIWLSRTGDYHNFDVHTPFVSDMSLEFAMTCRRREDVRTMLGLDRLLIFTNASLWTLDGGPDGLAPDSVRLRAQMEIGSGVLRPLTVDGAILFARAKGTGVRAVAYDDNRQAVMGPDISSIASHLFEEPILSGGLYGIHDWAYAEDPHGIIWVVRSDGVLLSLTFSASEQMWAWARHETDGYVTAVCAVPESTEDAVYISVRRGSYTYVERMASRIPSANGFVMAVDSAVTGTVVNGDTAPQTFTGLTHLEGKQVYIVSPVEAPDGPHTVTSGAVTASRILVTGGVSSVTVYIGQAFTADLETLGISQTDGGLRQKTTVAVGLEVSHVDGIYAGQDEDHLSMHRSRTVGTGYGSPSLATELVRVPVKGAWNDSARAFIRQTLPLPLSVYGVVREVEGGG